MNKPIRRVAFVLFVMFFLLLANQTFFIVFRQDSLNANPQNRRVRDAQFAQDRGDILAGGQPIATTKSTKDRFKYQRSYPAGRLYAPVTGFYSYDYGRSGLEDTYNTQLAGASNALFVRRLIDLVSDTPPQGASVQTTLNPKAQEAAAKALGSQKGAAVALDPQTGAVLAMVTSPSYDPNAIASHDLAAARSAYQSLSTVPDRPMANRAAREIYPPGSTFKLITTAAALQAGRKPTTLLAAPDRLKLPGTNTYLPNEGSCGGTKITLQQALRVSCNTAFAGLGLQLGATALRTEADKFGFDARPLPDIGAAASTFPDTLNAPQTALSAIGQFDVAASPLQMAMVSAAVANNGVLMAPYLVDTVRAPDLTPISTTRPHQLSQPLSATNAKFLQEMMVDVVSNGTGQSAQLSGVTVGGKTGTAQSDPKRKPFAWFTAWAATGNTPKVAVAAVVEDADIPRQDIAGGRLAAPIVKAVIEALR